MPITAAVGGNNVKAGTRGSEAVLFSEDRFLTLVLTPSGKPIRQSRQATLTLTQTRVYAKLGNKHTKEMERFCRFGLCGHINIEDTTVQVNAP